jgi:hypothetical protein
LRLRLLALLLHVDELGVCPERRTSRWPFGSWRNLDATCVSASIRRRVADCDRSFQAVGRLDELVASMGQLAQVNLEASMNCAVCMTAL